MPAALLAPAAPRLLLVGLEDHLAGELVRHLPASKWSIAPDHRILSLLRRGLASFDMVFCRARHPALSALLEAAGARSIPVIVVTDHPDVAEWLNAMDAGASDYTAPPFDHKQMAWILSANLRYGATTSVSSSARTVPQA